MPSSSSLHSATADVLLLSFDPTRMLQTIDAELRRAASLDPDVHAGLLALDTRFAELSEDDQTAVAIAMWAFASDRLAGGHLQRFRRDWLTDGGAVRRSMERALEGAFTVAALRELATRTRDLMSAQTEAAGRLRLSGEELAGASGGDSGVVVAHLLMMGAVVDYLMIVEGYTLQPPAPPPPPPPPPSGHHLKTEHPVD